MQVHTTLTDVTELEQLLQKIGVTRFCFLVCLVRLRRSVTCSPQQQWGGWRTFHCFIRLAFSGMVHLESYRCFVMMRQGALYLVRVALQPATTRHERHMFIFAK